MNIQEKLTSIQTRCDPILDNIQAIKGDTYTDVIIIVGQLTALAKASIALAQGQDVELAIQFAQTISNVILAFSRVIHKESPEQPISSIMKSILKDFDMLSEQINTALK